MLTSSGAQDNDLHTIEETYIADKGEFLAGFCEKKRTDIVYWGQGFASEAVRSILQVGFEDLDLNEIEARCVVANKRSVGLLHRLGFQKTERVPSGPGRGEFGDRMLPERSVFLLYRDKWIH